jgi:hypothetical protein
MIEVVNKIIALDREYAEAVEKFANNSHRKEKSEAVIETNKVQKNRFEYLKAEFNKKIEGVKYAGFDF